MEHNQKQTRNQQNENSQREKIFFNDNFITVTQARLVTPGKTYAMRNISSVTKYKIKRNIKPAITMIIIGIILFLFKATELKVLGGLLAIIGIILLFVLKHKYSLRISSNAGEEDGFISKNENYIQQVINAINDAMIHRG